MSESGLWSLLLGWPVLGTVAGLLIAGGFSVLSMNPPQYTLAQVMFALGSFVLAARAGWWLALEQSPSARTSHIIIGAVVIFGIIGAFCVGSVRWVGGLRESALRTVTQTSPELPKTNGSKQTVAGSGQPPTLLDLFRGDFPSMVRVGQEGDVITVKFADGTEMKVKARLYLDFDARTKFVGFYIHPSTSPVIDVDGNKTLIACLDLVRDKPDAIHRALEDLSEKVVVLGGSREEMTNAKDLIFTGRVFIYHDVFLSITQKAEIIKTYQENHLDVSFRGPDYLADQTAAWYRQHGAKAVP